jgi:hypothetical protein
MVVSRVVKYTPDDLFFGSKPNVSMLRVFGSQDCIRGNKEKRGNSDKRSIKGAFVGYEPNSKGWRVFIRNGKAWRPEVRRDVVFEEGSFMSHNSDNTIEEERYMLLSNDGNQGVPVAPVFQDVQEEQEEQSEEEQQEEPHEEHERQQEEQEDDTSENVPEQAPTIRQSRRVRWQPARYQDECHGCMAAVQCEVLNDEP